MTGFFPAATALLLLALAFVAWPLLRPPRAPANDRANLALLKSQLQQLDDDFAAGRTDAAAHAQSRAELERRVLDEERDAPATAHDGAPRATLVVLLVAVPLLGLTLYALLGQPQALNPAAMAERTPTQADMEQLVARLAERMEKQPPGQVADAEGWVMLGRSYAVLQRFPEAARALQRALQLTPDDAQLLADLGDVQAMQQGGRIEGESLQLIERALKLDPRNPKALALAGTAAMGRKDYLAAIAYWERARTDAPPQSEFAQGLERGIADARALAGGAASGAIAAPNSASAAAPAAQGVATARGDGAAPAAGAAAISGRVSVAPALAARLSPDDTVFVFARAAEGPRMPLAIVKRRAAELPFDFTLDDSMAMSPAAKLSAFAQVIVGARVSKSGNAMPQPGDLEGQAGPIDHRARGVTIVIDRARP